MCSTGFSNIINPTSILGRKVGGTMGGVIDPVTAIGNGIGGPVGGIVAPAEYIRTNGQMAAEEESNSQPSTGSVVPSLPPKKKVSADPLATPKNSTGDL